jgi:hypothetical protein
MKKKYGTLLLIGAFILFLNPNALTFSSGAPTGSSGSPASGGTSCARSGCHSGGPAQSSETVSIATDIPAAGFEENTNYTVTVTGNDGGRNLGTIAFMASVEDGSGPQGTVAVTNSNTTRKVGDYITHTFGGINATGGQNSWSFDWNSGTAPDQTTVYAAVNFANGNGGTSGDVIVNETLVLTKNQSVGLKTNRVSKAALYPNPAKGDVTLATNEAETENLKVINLNGKTVMEVDVTHKLDAHHWSFNVEALPSGPYFIKGASGLNVRFQKL